jgi:hypothetical protein
MGVADERKRKGTSRGNIHASARCRFSWTDTSTLKVRRRDSSLRTLAMRNSSAKGTLLSVKLSERPLTSWRLAAGAFASRSESRSRTARGAGRSLMLRYNIRSVMWLRNSTRKSRG